jgi:hypothetical protein
MLFYEAHKHLLCTIPSPKTDQVGGWEPCRHESFVKVDSRTVPANYTCLLCDVTREEPVFTAHCQDREHIRRALDIRRIQENKVAVQCAELLLRVDQLGLQAWRTEMFARMYQASSDSSVKRKRIKAAKALLCKFERIERISLLELAVWKAVCLAIKYDGCYMYHSWQEWIREEWKSSKHKVRNANEITIIIMSVLPFLAE